MRHAAAALIPLLFVLACSDPPTTGPSSPSLPTPTFTVSGRVIDSLTKTGIPHAAVTFAATDPAVAGKVATTGDAGDYTVSGLPQGGFAISVWAPNYFRTSKSMTLTADTTQSFELDRWAAASLTHTLTITASPSCAALPGAAKTRTYPVQVSQRSDGALVVLVVNSYDIMVGWGTEPGFTGKRDGNTVGFELTNDLVSDFSQYAMIERIPGVGDMGYVGTATGTIDNGTIVATFNGRYVLDWYAPTGGATLCQASDHRMEFVPAGS